MTTAQRVLDIARSQIGFYETPPGSNRTKYGREYGWDGVPWCAIFEWWVFKQAGMELPKKTAGVYDLMLAFQKTGRFFNDPEAGDVVIFSYGEGHTGILESFTATTITTIDGNTSTQSEHNGGQVMRRTRPRFTKVLGYGRPNYSAPTQKINKQTAEEEMDRFTVTYPDGSKIYLAEDGALEGYGVTVFASMHNIKPEGKINFTSAGRGALTPVDINNKDAGVVVWDRKGGRYDMNPGTKANLKLRGLFVAV